MAWLQLLFLQYFLPFFKYITQYVTQYKTKYKTKYKTNYKILIASMVLSVLLTPLPVLAQADCITNNVPSGWKDHFPFDLVYPSSTLPTSTLTTQCPTWEMFGKTREMCAPMQLAKVLKNAFVIKVGIQALLSL